ncbi:MAG: FAD-dependent oxidoreductase [Paracoccus sp. (in: a-proteobacteria)]|uniref:FAD-dependent oxidoreductase n=1 Tax=Paracoccus sp. TaxID=267 RepID=UPI0040582B5D
MDVIVIGGGLMGTAATFFLAGRGLKVALIERDRVGTGATVASFGNIRRTGRHLPQIPLANRSRALWPRRNACWARCRVPRDGASAPRLHRPRPL